MDPVKEGTIWALAALIAIATVTGTIVHVSQDATDDEVVVEERVQPVAPPTSAWTDRTYWNGKAKDWTAFYGLVCIHGIPHLAQNNSPNIIPIDREYSFQIRAYLECKRVEDKKARGTE